MNVSGQPHTLDAVIYTFIFVNRDGIVQR